MTPKDIGIQTPTLKVGVDAQLNVIIEHGETRLAFTTEQALMLAALILKNASSSLARSRIVPAIIAAPGVNGPPMGESAQQSS